MLYLVNEMTFSGYSVYNLDLLHIIAILLGVLVIISKNPIVSVLFLIGLFANISCYLIILGLSFIGLSYLIVYIGAVLEHVLNKAGLVQVQLYKVFLNLIKFFFDKIVNDNYSYMATSINILPLI